MLFFDFLALQLPGLKPRQAKLHLATWNGNERPLDEYLAGRFNEWQRWQTRKNFQRQLVISLIALDGKKWLYAGAYRSNSKPTWDEQRLAYHYSLEELPEGQEFCGRAIVAFERTGRQSYLDAEKWIDKLTLSEVRAEPLRVADFPGYRAVDLSFAHLSIVARQGVPSWKAALSNAAGIYLISDLVSGQLYVGSATGAGGLWQRWQAYAQCGHGGNAELVALIGTDLGRAASFRFSILETFDLMETPQAVLDREVHWKNVLLSRTPHGLNAN